MKRGSPSSTSSSAARNGATAGAIAGEWKAPATGRRMARLPRSPAISSARSKLALSPASTIWPGALSLATVSSAASAISAASAASAPTSAIIEPRSSASAISRPRSTTSSSASSTDRTSAAASTASSPSEWPAPALGCRSPASACQPAIEAQKMAGCWKRGALVHASEGVLADERGDALEQLRGSLGHEVAHLGRLRPLPRKQDGGAHGGHPCPSVPGFREGPVIYPPAGGCMTGWWGVGSVASSRTSALRVLATSVSLARPMLLGCVASARCFRSILRCSPRC